MTATSTRAAQVRARVDHPIIDADGHFVEVGPLLHDEIVAYLEESGGAALRDRFLADAARTLGAKSLLVAEHVKRPLASGAYRLDNFGLDSDYDYDPFWAACVDLGVAPVVHSSLQSHRVTRSISSYVYNHVDGLAAAH